MNNVTLKQVLTLLLMTVAMGLILVMMPDQQNKSVQGQLGNGPVAQQAAK